MPISNLAILAHIDAGKTTLSERILFLGKKIDVMGEVDEGLSTLDYLPEERRRGITIEAGYSSLTWKDRTIHLIDTPGHLDFGIEVDAALSAVEGAVLVISAVRGIQTQTLNHWHKLQALKIPTLIFVNKMDAVGAVGEDLILSVEEALHVKSLVLSLPSGCEQQCDGVLDLLQDVHMSPKGADRREVVTRSLNAAEEAWVHPYRSDLWNLAGEYDEAVFDSLCNEQKPELQDLLNAISQIVQKQGRQVILFGSAKRNYGVRQLLNAMRYFLPGWNESSKESSDAQVVGQVVKARWRKDMGHYYLFKAWKQTPANALGDAWKLHAEELEWIPEIRAGELCALSSNNHWEIGDLISATGHVLGRAWSSIYVPLLRSRLDCSSEFQDLLSPALQAIAKTDPSLWVQMDSQTGQWVVSTVGEVYLEVLQARLLDEFGIQVLCAKPEVYKQERWLQTTDIQEEILMPQGGIQLELSLRPIDEPIIQVMIVGLDLLPDWFQDLAESVIHDWARKGIKGQGEIVGLRVILHGVVWNGQALPGVAAKAIHDALTWKLYPEMVALHVPWVAAEIQLPWDAAGVVMDALQTRKAELRSQDVRGPWMLLRLEIPVENTLGLTSELRSLSHGQASWTASYCGHRAIKSDD
jgi:elongation factor G